jgi:predicted glycogen debranching enzyme
MSPNANAPRGGTSVPPGGVPLPPGGDADTQARAADDREWLEADGLGGFACGTASGIRTRRYHALLLTATTPPTGRMVLVNGFDAFLDTPSGTYALSSQRYEPGVVSPDGAERIVSFTTDPWPTWVFDLPCGTSLQFELFVPHERPAVVLRWQLRRGTGPISLRVRPFFSGRDYHSMHHENGAFQFEPVAVSRGAVRFAPYAGVPGVTVATTGTYRHAPAWYRRFLYDAEAARGLDAAEDLAAPGEFTWTIETVGDGALAVLLADRHGCPVVDLDDIERLAACWRDAEQARRASFPSALDRAADAYLVRRGAGRTLVAGYPWFTDWGRDTFIAIRGLCLATGRLAEARDILIEWAGAVAEGMLPNRFPDSGELAEFNSVDASLWYIVAVHELLERARSARGLLMPSDDRALRRAVADIVAGYARGTRFGIRMDDDGLLMAGAAGVQLTWMDARVGDRVITPRVGKPVEIQALWLNALSTAARDDDRWSAVLARGRAAFLLRFWNESAGSLADVIDVDHQRGVRDDTVRPNQILAVGGLPLAVLEGERARRVVDLVERDLLTPIGLRSLARAEPGYSARYEGAPDARDAVYHQGTVWPWLLGPFVDAWLRVRGNTPAARREARRRFVAPLVRHLDAAGIGHVSEIADAEPPFTPRGCPFQAWSVGELIRLDRQIVGVPSRRQAPAIS